MRKTLFLYTALAVLLGLVESHCGLGGCACSDEPNGSCCPGYTCGPQRRCCEIVVERDEFLYEYPYNFNNYGYTQSGVPGFYSHYDNYLGYAIGSPAFGNNYVGYDFGRDSYVPYF